MRSTGWANRTCYLELKQCYVGLKQYDTAIALHEQEKAIAEKAGDRTGVERACSILGKCYQSQLVSTVKELKAAQDWSGLVALEATAVANVASLQVARHNHAEWIYTVLGVSYQALGRHSKAIALFDQGRAIAKKMEELTDVGRACNNMGACHT